MEEGLRQLFHFSPSSYYSKKQGTLLLTPGCRGRSQGQGYTELSHRGLNFYCQAVRISGLSHAQLASLLHRLHKAGAPLGGAGGTRGRGDSHSGPILRTSPSFLSYWLPHLRFL